MAKPPDGAAPSRCRGCMPGPIAPVEAAALEAACGVQQPLWLATSLREAQTLLDDGNVADAKRLADQVATACHPGDGPLRGWALLVCGSASCLDAQYELAYLNASEAYTLLSASDDLPRALEALSILVAVYCETDDFDRAVEAAKSGIELSVQHAVPEMTMRLLHSLGWVLHRGGEFPEAIRCLDEAIALHAQLPVSGRDPLVRFSTELAFVHQSYGEHLAQHGQVSLADAHFRSARASLARLMADSPGGHTVYEIRSMEARVHLQATWHDWQGARQSAARFIRTARRRNSPRRSLAAAMNALCTLHRAAGDLPRAIRYQHRSMAILRDIGLTTAVKESAQRLAELHAQLGAYKEALAWHQEAASLQATQSGRNNALRCRLAALERQANRRGTLAREQLLHARRMMVIGRLIARIHHAMLSPLQRANERIVEVARSIDAEQSPARVVELLREAGLELDQAASLTRQLKLFSYRSTPQLSALSLEESLRSAWNGLLLCGRPQDWSLSVTHDAGGAEALGDAQRLGILLTILLIELAPQNAGQPGRVIWAKVEPGGPAEPTNEGGREPTLVVLKIGVSGDLEVAGEPSLGLALCAEIAQEMNGQLDCEYDGVLVRGYRLTLPQAVVDHAARRHDPEGLLLP